MKAWLSILIIPALSGGSGQAEAVAPGLPAVQTEEIILSVDEWNVPWDDSWSRDPYVGPDGIVYFVGQRAHYVGWFDPETEEFGYHDLEEGTGPHNVLVIEEGTAWYTALRSHHIGRVDVPSGEITRFTLEDELIGPHTMALDRHGNFWFSAYGGNGVGHFNVATGEIRGVRVPTDRSRPYGIVMSPDGERPWVSLFGTNKIATVDPETMELEEIVLPREEIRPRRLNITSDGNVWYGDYAGGIIGRYNPADGSITEWDMPQGPEAAPYAVLVDDRDRLWLSASGLNPNSLVAFDTRAEAFTASVEIETGRGAIRNMVFDAETRSIWFGTDTGHIGRVRIN
ncbi:MAG: hypothetical protein WD097_00310 [Balneolales bacterium]